MRLRHLSDPDSLPALDKSFAIERPALGLAPDAPPVRILLLYGSLRARSFSRLAVEEAARLLQFFGAETRIFDPSDLPLPDQVQSDDHPAVKELRALSEWSEGQVWCSPERHGQITSVMKAQIDHLPLEMAGIRPTQGRTLAVMQVSGGSQSFNAVNTLRLLGRWMRMFTIPNQSSIAKAFQEFDAAGRMKPSPYYDRIADVMEELVRFTALVRPHREALTDRYSERKAAGHVIDEATDLSSIRLGRRKRMFTIPNKTSIAKAFQEFDAAGRMKPSPYYDRIADVMEELVRFTALVRPHREALTDRYSERKAAGHVIDEATDLSSIAIAPQPLPESETS